MLTSEFQHELGALIRSLEHRVVMEPALQEVMDVRQGLAEAMEQIERAIVTLVALHVNLQEMRRSD